MNKVTYNSTSEILKGWHIYFSELYSPSENACFDQAFKTDIEAKFNKYQQDNPDHCEELDKDITVSDVTSICKKLKSKVAGGIDQLVYEHLSNGTEVLYNHIAWLFTLMIQRTHVPPEMKKGIVITILKPGKKEKRNPDNYRGINLLPVMYKLFEKVSLVRILNRLKSEATHFPDPLQGAYQPLLSSVNTTFSIKETINYNVERGSKVFLCLLDTMKAFDYVWHCGLMVRLYEAGIKGKMWKLIQNAYKSMTNYVLHNKMLSDPIKVLQGTRQGSDWGAYFFLVFIDALIRQLRTCGTGTYIGNIFCGIFLQADDIALLAVSKDDLQLLMDICYNFACKWRFIIHPLKTKILVFGESNKNAFINKHTRVWRVGSSIAQEVESHTHCGVELTTKKSSISVTKTLCRKGRGIMLSLHRVGLGDLNPLTYTKLYKTIVLPSALFGCELWSNISETEYEMLERMQRFCAKLIQRLGRRTRSDICCPMLGLLPIRSYIEKAKLNFLRRMIQLPGYAVSKRILLQRYFHSTYSRLSNIVNSGYCPDISEILKKYNLVDILEYFFKNGHFCEKIPWKKITCNAITQTEKVAYEQRMEGDIELMRFHAIQEDITKPNRIWFTARSSPRMSNKCFTIAKVISKYLTHEITLCEFCGRKYNDSIKHFSTICDKTSDLREQFWEDIINSHDVQISANLFNVDDDVLTNILLGAKPPFPLSIDTLNAMFPIFTEFVYKICTHCNL